MTVFLETGLRARIVAARRVLLVRSESTSIPLLRCHTPGTYSTIGPIPAEQEVPRRGLVPPRRPEIVFSLCDTVIIAPPPLSIGGTEIPTLSQKAPRRKAEYGSDLVVVILRAYGFEYVCANIGSSFRGVWDSVVNYGGDREPRALSVLHEEVAVAIAHGYFKASGRPMAVLLHDLVGLQHASMAIFNAWCDRVPMLLLGAAGPMGTEKRRPWIDWVHTAETPNTQVRYYV